MALTASTVETSFRAIRSASPGSTVQARYKATSAIGIRGALETEEVVGELGNQSIVTSGARFLVSDWKKTPPQEGGVIEIKESANDEWYSRVILSVRYDQMRATMFVGYGSEFA
jgi:hypothetical protein